MISWFIDARLTQNMARHFGKVDYALVDPNNNDEILGNISFDSIDLELKYYIYIYINIYNI